MGEIILTLVALATVAIVPVVVAAMTGARRGSTMMGASIAAAVVAALWTVYWIAFSQPRHFKHAVLFVVLTVVMLVAASFSRPVEPLTSPRLSPRR